jgi:hypothetical protein
MSESAFDNLRKDEILDDGQYPEPDYSQPLPQWMIDNLRARNIEIPERFLPADERADKQVAAA